MVGNITMILPDGDIDELIQGKSLFEFASDGGHDPSSGISTFGWVASINGNIIAQARGPAQCHPLLAESFRAEGYGIASAAQFATNMIGRFKINAKEHEWFFYLDNKSMIQRLEGYSQIYTPKWNLRPDKDITKLAHKLLHTIPHQFTHVKSHQDNIKNDKKLPFPAVMNIMADQLASRQRNLMTKPDSTVTNLATAQLRIKDVCITRDSQKWLLHSAGKIPIQSYYQEKFGWTETVFDNIAWDVQQAALKSFPVADQTRLLKFVHGWLPMASRLFKEGTATSKRCPICQAPREDNLHLLHCTNKEMERIQEKMQLALVKDMHDHGDSELCNIIEISILNAGVVPDWTPILANVSRKWKAAIRDQTKIGWMHIIHGRFSKTLIQAVNQHYESQEISAYLYNGTRWAKKIITAIWTIILEL
jgi:hypothetical protein